MKSPTMDSAHRSVRGAEIRPWVYLAWSALAAVGFLGVSLAFPWGSVAAAEGSLGDVVFGKHTYRSFCASCHGAAGAGDGDLAPYLTIQPTDLTQLAASNGGEFPRERVRRAIDGRDPVPGHAGGDMPAWGYAFRELFDEGTVEQKIDQLVAYLESLQTARETPAR